MSPRTKQVNTLIREQMAAHLLEAALKVFASRGYHTSTMAEIAKEAGVSKGLVYHYFESKEALLILLAERRLQQWSALIEGLESYQGPMERFLFLIEFLFDELEKKREELRFYNSLYLSEDGVHAIEQAMEKYRDQFERLFQVERQLFIDLGFEDPELEATFFRSTLQGISLEYMLTPQYYPLKQIKKMLIAKYRI
jgi:AcrR family transcriptional regulator